MEKSQPLHILHVEDDEVDAELIRQTLLRSDLDCRLTLAMSRDEYLRALDKSDVDLILSDNRGYDFDGLEVLRLVRRNHPSVPFLFLSGSFEGKDLERLKAEGANDCLLKSDAEALVPAIHRALAGNSPGPRDFYLRGLEHLVQVIQELPGCRDMEAVVTRLCRAARQMSGADAAVLSLKEGELCHVIGEDAVTPYWKGRRYPCKETVTGWVIEHGQPLVVDDMDDPRVAAVSHRNSYVKSMAVVPLGKPEISGSLSALWRGRHRPTDDEVRLMGMLADAGTLAMENVRSHAALERQLRETRRDLGMVTKELDAFSYSVSHDLRGPLRSVSGFGKLLAKDYEDRLDDAGKNFLAYVTDGTLRISGLVDALLELSRVARAPLDKAQVDLSAMAGEVVAELHRSDSGRRCQVIIQPSLHAQADPRLARVLLENLLGNAWKFTSRRAEAHVEFGSTPEAGHDIFYVKDDGAGFEMAYADKLFTPFQRQHRQDEFEGAGVGLATAQRIVMRHGGRIWAEAVEGEGATFFFTLEDGAEG
ncbi:MAG TPA: ATP-binding protein [Gammaproteobacteria bacterium]|nr:ATP-binding protein [Gammaproteobacteria bacterium]